MGQQFLTNRWNMFFFAYSCKNNILYYFGKKQTKQMHTLNQYRIVCIVSWMFDFLLWIKCRMWVLRTILGVTHAMKFDCSTKFHETPEEITTPAHDLTCNRTKRGRINLTDEETEQHIQRLRKQLAVGANEYKLVLTLTLTILVNVAEHDVDPWKSPP